MPRYILVSLRPYQSLPIYVSRAHYRSVHVIIYRYLSLSLNLTPHRAVSLGIAQSISVSTSLAHAPIVSSMPRPLYRARYNEHIRPHTLSRAHTHSRTRTLPCAHSMPHSHYISHAHDAALARSPCVCSTMPLHATPRARDMCSVSGQVRRGLRGLHGVGAVKMRAAPARGVNAVHVTRAALR